MDPMGGLSYLHTALKKTSGSYGRIILFTHCTRGNKWTQWEDYPIYTLHSRKQVDPMGGLSYLHTALEETSGPYGRIILFTHCTRENKWTQWEDYPIYTLHSRKQVDPMGGLSYLHTALEKTSGSYGGIILFTHCTRENKWTLWEEYPIYTLHSRKQMDPMGGLSYLHTGLEKTSGPYGRIILFTHWTRENKWTLWEDYPTYTLHSRKQVDPMGGLSYLYTALEKTSGSYGRIILFTHCTRENKWTLWEDYPIYTLHSRKQVDPMGGLSYLHTALEKTSGPNGRITLFTHCTRENKWILWEDYPIYTLHSRKQVDPMGGLSYLHTALKKTSGSYGRIILFTHCTRGNKWTQWEDYPIYTLHSRKQVDPMGGFSYLHTALEKTSGPYGRIILFTHCTRENKWTLWEDYPIYTLDSRKQVDPMGGLSYLHTALEKTSGPYGRIILFTHCTRPYGRIILFTHCTQENKWILWEDYPIYTLHSRKQVDLMGGFSYLHTALEKTSGPYGRIILFTHCTRENKWTLWEDYPIYTLDSRKQVDPMGGLSYLHTALEKTSGPYGRIILFTHCTRPYGKIILFTHCTQENKWILWEDYPIYTLHSRKQVDLMGGLSYLHTALEKTSGPYGRIILFTHCTRENKWTQWEDYPIYTLHSRKQVDPMGGLSYLHTALEKTSGPYGRIILFTHCTQENKWILWEDYPIYTLHSRKQVDPMGGLSYLHTALEETSGPNGRIILFTHCTRENKWILWEDYPIYTLDSRKQVDPMGGLSYLHTALKKTSGSYGRIILFTHCTRGNKWTQWEDYPIYTLHSRKQVDPMGGFSYLHTALEKTSGPYGRIILFTHCTRGNKWTLWEDYPIYTLHSRKQVDPMGGLSYLHTGLEKTSGPYGRIILFTHCTRENKWTLWEDYPIYTLHSRKQVDPMGGLSYLHTGLEKTSGPYGRIILFTHRTRENKWTLWKDYPIYTLHSTLWEDYPIYTLHSRKQVDHMGGLSYLHTALEKTSGPYGRIILLTHCTRENKWTLWEDYSINTLHSRKQVDPMGGLSYLHTALEKTSGPYGRIILFTHCTRRNKWILWEDYPIYTLHSRKQVDPMGGIILFTHCTRENKWTLWEDNPIYTLHSRKQVDPMGGLSYLHTALEKTSESCGRIIRHI